MGERNRFALVQNWLNSSSAETTALENELARRLSLAISEVSTLGAITFDVAPTFGVGTTLPAMTAGGTSFIYAGTETFLHAFYPTGAQGNNLFAGEGAGNLTMAIAGGASTRASFLTGVGHEALKSVTIGTGSTATGFHALRAMTEGGYNDAYGDVSLFSLTTGSYNSAFGQASQYSNVDGVSNVAVGVGALYLNSTGDGNIGVGQQALYSMVGDGSMGIGYKAGYHDTASSQFYLDNYLATRADIAAERANALLYGTFASTAAAQTLTVNAGSFNVSGDGPHAIGGVVNPAYSVYVRPTLTSATADSVGLIVTPTINASGTNSIHGTLIGPVFALTGAGVSNHTVVSSLTVNAPTITYNDDTATTAASLYVTAAPIGAASNYAIWAKGTNYLEGYTLFGANIYTIGTAGSSGETSGLSLAVVGANAQKTSILQATTTKTTSSGTGTETIAALIPAGSLVLGVTARVTTILAGAALTTWSLGIPGFEDRFGSGLALAAGTTVSLANIQTGSPFYAATATNVVMTAAAGVFSTGAIRLTVHYISLTAETS